MVRKFISLDGEVLAEEEWIPTPMHDCFYCGDRLITSLSEPCYFSLDGNHDWITLADRDYVS